MYKIIKDGKVLGQTESVTYITLQDNDCFALATEEDAQGIVHGGVPYHLLGRAEMPGTETVVLEQTDAGAQLSDIQGAIDDLVIASLEATMPEGEMMQNV